ncbi:MAG: C45 family peptidase [Planctomycetes bacterium]|nr:C45 family peptidase [Planctomycetota bacterium]
MTAGREARPPVKRRIPRVARIAAWTSGALVVAWFAFAAWVESAGIYVPPALDPADPGLRCAVEDAPGGVRRCGNAWVHREPGIGEIHLEGSPATRGHAMAALCRDDLAAQEDTLFRELDRLLPGALRRYFVRKGVLFAFRDLQRHVELPYQIETAALAQELDRLPRGGPAAAFPEFHRALFYQTLYDTGQAMAEAGIVEAEIGCTSFAASGAATASGSLVVARNCDFEAGAVFDERKLVQFVAPDGGARYVAVSWAGMLGVVSGVNEHGLVVMLHAARTERTRWPRPGTPVPFLLRDALMHDRTIEDVAARFRRTPDHAAAIVLVAESETGRSAAVETDPDRTVVVPQTGDTLVVANSLRATEWRDDAVVRATQRAGSGPVRQRRMEELVSAAAGRIDAPRAAAMLRDRAGLGGADVGTGNRSSIAALNAAHAVVYDAAAGVLHVSKAPRGTGEFVAYDIASFLRGVRPNGPANVRVPGPSIAPSIDNGAAARVDEARLLLRSAEAARADGDADGALTMARRADELTASIPEALLAVAEALVALGRRDEARAAAARGLARQPVPGPERDRLTALAAP